MNPIATDVETTGLEWWKPEFRVTHFGFHAPPDTLCIDTRENDGAGMRRAKQIASDNPNIVHNSRFEGNIFKHHWKIAAKIDPEGS